ncbi:accessory factor associated with RNA polymerase II [Sorochytrium milnesiophthora]
MSVAERLRDALSRRADSRLELWADPEHDIAADTLAEATHIAPSGADGQRRAKDASSGFAVAKGPLSMAALHILWQLRDAPFATYMTSALQQQLPNAAVAERQDIIDYLRGAKSTSQYLTADRDAQQASGEQYDGAATADRQQERKRAATQGDDQSDAAKVRRISAQQYTSRTRMSYMTPPTSHRSFAHLTKLCYDAFIRNKPPPSVAAANAAAAAAAAAATANGTKGDAAAGKGGTSSSSSSRGLTTSARRIGSGPAKDPIIIVPPSMSCAINMFNVRKFLEQALFQTGDEAKMEQGGRKPSSLEVSRKAMLSGATGKKQWKLVVVDSTERFEAADWDRVVAVFAGGMVWQFDGWMPPYNNPIELFARVKGFHVKFADEELRSPLDKWNVRVMSVHRNKRHLDQPIVLDFWTELEKWISVNKPHLLA